jgi:bifunctional UDP-N-acetylglucosamine pyrophosphorylase / glucosamine-1-phosphate N-acetyltransferase
MGSKGKYICPKHLSLILENKNNLDSDKEKWMEAQGIPIKELLLINGVGMPSPESVYVGDDVHPDRISGEGVVMYPGTRVYGRSTFISRNVQLGGEGPVVMENCFVGPGVKLKGGFFQKSVFLEGAAMGAGAHVREGTIFEEQAGAAHAVGLKQTILFPFVTLGSLINFCDCFMAGGTSRENHSEVGSSYIHFNYTPNQDKATPSLLGDVASGVMLNQPPIFLGGQGGLVGPCRLAYGTVIAAGTINRKDELRTGRFIFEGQPRSGNTTHIPGIYRGVKRVLINNMTYIANLLALRQWYRQVRVQFISEDFPPLLLDGLTQTLTGHIAERVYRLGQFCLKLPDSAARLQSASKTDNSRLIRQKFELFEKWPELEDFLDQQSDYEGDKETKDRFLNTIQSASVNQGKNYLYVIKGLTQEEADIGTKWLQGIIEGIMKGALAVIPSFNT